MNNHFEKELYRVCKTKARLYEDAEDALENLYKNHGSELLFNEIFEGYLIENNWVRGKALKDGYEGIVNISSLKEVPDANSKEGAYTVKILFAPVYKEPHLKSHIFYHIPYASRVDVTTAEKSVCDFFYCETAKGWLHNDHIIKCPISPKTNLMDSLVHQAQLFLGCPYIFGGKTAFGIDCSALIQLIFMPFGYALPRDTGPQIEFFKDGGGDLKVKEVVAKGQNLQKGDIVYFPGHVGIMQDEQKLIHASGKSMQVVSQDILEVSQYYLYSQGQGMTHIFRLK